MKAKAAELIPTEEQEQRTVVEWLELHDILFAAIPNGGHRRKVTAAILKGQGVKPGVPDLLIFTKPPKYPHYRGVAIEMKRRKDGTLSRYQEGWLAALESEDWLSRICLGADEAIELLEHLGYGRRHEI